MKPMNRINSINATRLNNAEYANFSQRVAKLIQTATVAKLGIDADDFAAYTANITLLTDVVAQSRVSDETVSIADQDKECDDLLRYVFGTIDTGLRSPLADQRTAATTLANQVKPYRGIQSLAQGQQIQQTRGLLVDLGKDENAPHINTLALGAGIQALRQANNRYATLIDTRAASQSATALPSGKLVRDEMVFQYDELTTRAFVTSVATPTPEADAFVVAINKLIADTMAAYNQRMAQTRAAAEKKKGAE